MEKVYYLIILLYLITIIKGMALSDGNLHLDNLFQKSFCIITTIKKITKRV